VPTHALLSGSYVDARGEPMTTELASDPIIVYGAPRSGTTYLQRLLSSHPDVFISDETRVFAWLHEALKLTQDHRFLANDGEAVETHLRVALPQAIREFYAARAPGVHHWGDKNPHYADPYNKGCLELVADLFPGSRFIHIIRDGRDVASSLVRKEWEGKPWVSFEDAHRTWKRHLEIGRAFGETLPDSRYFELRYEALVADDTAIPREMFGFLELDFHPEVEAFCRAQQEERTPFRGPTRDLRQGVNSSDWAHVFTPKDQERSLRMIGSELVETGYETVASLARLREDVAARQGAPDTPQPSR